MSWTQDVPEEEGEYFTTELKGCGYCFNRPKIQTLSVLGGKKQILDFECAHPWRPIPDDLWWEAKVVYPEPPPNTPHIHGEQPS